MSESPTRPVGRFLALFLSIALILPNPAFALRQTGLEESEGPGKTKEQLVTALTTPSNPADPIGAPSAGLESKRVPNWVKTTALVAGGAVAGAGATAIVDRTLLKPDSAPPAASSAEPRPGLRRDVTQWLIDLLPHKVGVDVAPGRLSVLMAPPWANNVARGYLLGAADQESSQWPEERIKWHGHRPTYQTPPDVAEILRSTDHQGIQLGANFVFEATEGAEKNSPRWNWKTAQVRVLALVDSEETAQKLDEVFRTGETGTILTDLESGELGKRIPGIRLLIGLGENEGTLVYHYSPSRAGLEEKPQGAAGRLARIENLIAEHGGIRGMAPPQLADVSVELRELASSSEDVDVAMRTQQTRISHGAELRPPALNAVESSGGSWTRPDGTAPLVFVFEGPHLAWAPFVAQAGAPVGIIADTLWRAEGMRDMLKELGVPERQFMVVSLDVEGDRSRAWQTIQGHFSLPGFPAPEPITFSEDSSAAEIERILRGYGFNFRNSPTPRLREVDLYLSSRA